MSGKVTLRHEGNVAVIAVDNPPVNALSHAVRSGLADAFTRARDDANVEAIVLTAGGRTFVAGADITEFDKPPMAPGLSDVIALIESIGKPVVAAVFGTPLGGGLEITLACHFRIAASGTRLGLPEIKLGLIPGAGGTQRLPRLVGMQKAAAMILSGDPIPAKDALASGLIDEIFDGEPATAGIAFAHKVIAEKRPLTKARDREDKLADLRADPKAFDAIVAANSKRGRALDAPSAAIEVLRAALDVPFDEALALERAAFMRLRTGDQSKAQRHIFFAEREATKIPGLTKDVKAREIRRVAVIGAGTMGGGIAMCFLNVGIPVTLIEASTDALQRGLGTIEKNYRASAARGSLSEADVGKRLSLLNGVTDMNAAKDADIVIEAAFEDMGVKREIFGHLDRVTGAQTIFATNTSYLDVNEIAHTTKRPASVLGMHFFSPANVMKLLEIVRGADTAPDILATALAVARQIRKVPVVVGVSHGFVGNRMLRIRSIEAERLLLEGALPQDVDDALTDFGFPMGPFAMADLAGLDISWRMRKAQGARAEIADQLCEAGRFGQKTGKGFYIYDSGSRTPRPDPEVESLIVASSKRLGVTRAEIDRKTIIERLIFPMINEGARILEEGVALRPGDIDVIWIYGYGFPLWRGGPMFYADTIGLGYIRDRLQDFAQQTGDSRHEPAALLNTLASEGRGFGSLTKA